MTIRIIMLLSRCYRYRKITPFDPPPLQGFVSETSAEDQKPNPLARAADPRPRDDLSGRAGRGRLAEIINQSTVAARQKCLRFIFPGPPPPPDKSITATIMIIICKQTPAPAAVGPSPAMTCRRLAASTAIKTSVYIMRSV